MIFSPYIKYLSQAKNWRGHGIHSPFVFDLVRNVMPDDYPFYAFERLKKTAGKQKNADRKRRELLFRLLNASPNARNLLILGGTPADAMYLAAVNPSATCFFISQDAEKAFFDKKNLKNVHIARNLAEVLRLCPSFDFVFFNKTEKKEMETCLQHIHQGTFFAFSDTFSENAENWAFILQDNRVQLRLRTFRLGLVYFNPEIQPGNYTLLYR
jgi:hypothetical protein